MPDYRAFCEPDSAEPARITLSAEESRHLVLVNRARVGATVTAFDGKGTEWICELEKGGRPAVLKVRFTQKAKPLPHRIALGQAMPQGGFMDDIVHKATELGAARIIPLQSERTEVHMEPERAEKKLDKWRTAAREAAKQCGNPWLPQIDPVVQAATFMNARHDCDLKLIASLHPGAGSLKKALASFEASHGRRAKSALWLVGPEGDFTPAEMSIALGAGFEPITLGPLVLRCETAASYALSVLAYEISSA